MDHSSGALAGEQDFGEQPWSQCGFLLLPHVDNPHLLLRYVLPRHKQGYLLRSYWLLQGVPHHWAHFVFVIFSDSRAHTEGLFIAIG